MEQRRKILDRIRKMENLAESTTSPDEADCAKRLISRLKSEYAELLHEDEPKIQEGEASVRKIFSARYSIRDLSDKDLAYYMDALKTIARQLINPPGRIVWKTRTERQRYFLFSVSRHDLYISFESESENSVEKMKNIFFAITELVPC